MLVYRGNWSVRSYSNKPPQFAALLLRDHSNMNSLLATYGSVDLATVKQLLGFDIHEPSSAADCIAQASDLGSSMVVDSMLS